MVKAKLGEIVMVAWDDAHSRDTDWAKDIGPERCALTFTVGLLVEATKRNLRLIESWGWDQEADGSTAEGTNKVGTVWTIPRGMVRNIYVCRDWLKGRC